MYGTQLAEEGLVKCNIKTYDYNQFYRVWKCPRVVVEVAVNFPHTCNCFFIKSLTIVLVSVVEFPVCIIVYKV